MTRPRRPHRRSPISLREDSQWLLAGILAGAGCLSACLFLTLAAYLLGLNPTAFLSPAASPTSTPPLSVSPVSTPPVSSSPVSTPPISNLQSPIPPISPVPNLPPSGLIVFTCFHAGFDNICSINADGSNLQTLANAPATDFYPELSPRGDLITFSSRRSGEFRIYLMDRSGGNLRQVGPDAGSHFAPDISPDGTQIVFANALGRYQNIWVMNIDGSDPRPLTTGPHNDVDPVWSPDGARIAFSSDRGWRPAHWIMDANGQNMRMLLDTVAEHGGRSDWSPDGQWLAFYAGPRDSRDVYLVATNANADGAGAGQSRRLTFSGRNLAPAFSPDGAWIVFTSYREGDNANLFIMRPDGSDVRQLTTDPRPDWQPRWGP